MAHANIEAEVEQINRVRITVPLLHVEVPEYTDAVEIILIYPGGSKQVTVRGHNWHPEPIDYDRLVIEARENEKPRRIR